MDFDSIRREFGIRLGDLTFNDKNTINELTLFAQNKKLHGKEIIAALQTHLKNAQPQLKIPFMYLLDSILKNVGPPYVIFTEDIIVEVFTIAFNAVNKDDKLRLSKLLDTWKNYQNKALFSPNILNQLDMVVFKPSVNPSFIPKSTTVETDNSLNKFLKQQIESLLVKKKSEPVQDAQKIQVLNQLLYLVGSQPVDTEMASTITKSLEEISRNTKFSQPPPRRNSNDRVQRGPSDPRGRGRGRSDRGSRGPPSQYQQQRRPPYPQQRHDNFEENGYNQQQQRRNYNGNDYNNDYNRPPRGDDFGRMARNDQFNPQYQSAPPPIQQRDYGYANNFQQPFLIPNSQQHFANQIISDPSPNFDQFQNQFIQQPQLQPQLFPQQQPQSNFSLPLTIPFDTNLMSIFSAAPTMPILPTVPNLPNTNIFIPPIAATNAVSNPLAGVDTSSLLASLMKSGFLNKVANNGVTTPPSLREAPRKVFLTVLCPLTTEEIKIPRQQFVQTIYEDLKLYCNECGLRLVSGREKKMSEHKDWHFRQNRRLKESNGGMGKAVVSRDWYFGEEDWCDGVDREEVVMVPFQDEKESKKRGAGETEEEILVIPDMKADLVTSEECFVCGEELEKFWSEEAEEWMIRNCVTNSDGAFLHFTCQLANKKQKMI